MKKISDSISFLSELMLPSHANPAGKVHGGDIMKMMDNCGGVAAARHAKSNVVTMRVDEMVFHHPIIVGQVVICKAELVFAGRSSMEVRITVEVEDLLSEAPPKVALTAFFTYVAVDGNSKPTEVPQLLLETEEEKEAYEKGRLRYLAHKASN